MATRLQISTHYPDRMGEKAGQRNYFPEKIMAGNDVIRNTHIDSLRVRRILLSSHSGYSIDVDKIKSCTPKTTTIRKNYKFWKSKEGKMIQPFIWAGKPYRSKHVVFCPEVRLKRVYQIVINSKSKIIHTLSEDTICDSFTGKELDRFAQSEGFDSVEDFFMWFDKDFNGALLEFEE